MRNGVFPHFSSSFCSSGENDEVRLPIPNVSVDVHGLNSIGNGFFLDHVSHDLQLGSFTPLSRTMEFTHPLDVMPGGGNGYKTSSMYKDTLHQKKTTSVSPDQDATRNARKRVGGNVGLNPEATIAACKKKKGLHYAENDRQHMQEPSASVVQPMKAPMRRSHKLGDKITALQQLVSPFGKTDTASVLQEATVYIKHLQDQIQVLSNPYFRFKASLHPQGGGLGEEKANLRIRGLCLVPVSTSANVAIEADNINQYTTTGPSSVPRV